MQGTLLIDKPSGITSHDVIAILRRKLGVKKIGHAGTLDPLATGLLIILVGRENTKRQSEFMVGDKEYLCRARLGLETDTYDIEGKIIKELAWSEVKNIKAEDIKKLLNKFRGKIKQRVPAFSAVKVKGKKLYEAARKGKIDIAKLPVKEVEIKKLELINFDASYKGEGLFFELKIVCSKGTYIRSLIHDIGQELGVGATVTALRRTRSGEFNVSNAKSIENIMF